MQPHEAETYRLYSRLPAHRRRVDRAMGILAAGLDGVARPYVAFSAGKDSAVLLHLARMIRPDIEARILTWPETPLLGDFARVIAAWRGLGAAITVVEMHRGSLDESVPDRWARLHADADAVLIGLRADESQARRATLRAHGVVYQPKVGPRRICPLAWMRVEDIGALTVAHGLPCLSSYTAEGLASRTTTRVPRDEVRDVALGRLRERDPAAYARLRLLYPGEIA